MTAFRSPELQANPTPNCDAFEPQTLAAPCYCPSKRTQTFGNHSHTTCAMPPSEHSRDFGIKVNGRCETHSQNGKRHIHSHLTAETLFEAAGGNVYTRNEKKVFQFFCQNWTQFIKLPSNSNVCTPSRELRVAYVRQYRAEWEVKTLNKKDSDSVSSEISKPSPTSFWVAKI